MWPRLLMTAGPPAQKAVHKSGSSSVVIDTGNCLSRVIMAPNASSYQQ